MRLTRAGDAPSRTVNPNWYTGTVWTTAFAESEAPHRLRVVLATFLPGARTPDLPFGDVTNSGFERELSDLGIYEFVNKKLVTVTVMAA